MSFRVVAEARTALASLLGLGSLNGHDVAMAGPGGEPRRTATVTILFCDLVGSTARQATTGDDEADEFRRAFFSVLTSAVSATSGEIVKNTGDGLMVVFRESAVDGVTCASRMHDGVEALDNDNPAYLRVGLSAGEAAFENGDWFGTPVVEAARLCSAAEAGQTLVSEIVRGLVGSRGGHQFRSVGALTLKGLASPVPAAAVIRTPISAGPQRSSRARRRWVMPALIATVAALTIATLGTQLIGSARPALLPSVSYVPGLEQAPCPPAFLAQVPNGTCADLVVPEDRTNPRGRALHLLITRAPALAASPASDPTISITRATTSVSSQARAHSEVLSFGTRLSFDPDPAMACPEFEQITVALLTAAVQDRTLVMAGQRALRTCHDRLTRSGVALAHFTYEDAGNDVVDLIRALHLTSVNLAASARSALAAFVVVRDAPKVVRTLTLENPWPPGQYTLDPTAQLASAFDQYVALCETDRQCHSAYPNLAQLLRNDWAQDNAHPQVVLAEDPSTHYRHPVLVNGDTAAFDLAVGLGNPIIDPLLAAGVARGTPELAAGLALSWRSIFFTHNFPWASFLSGWCSQHLDVPNPGHTISSQSRPELAGVDGGPLQWACAGWPVPQAPASTFAPVASTVPTLIVIAPLDAQLPLQSAATVAAGLPNTTVLTLATLGAGAVDSGTPACLNELRRAFLTNPTQHLDAAHCAAQSPPIKFVTAGS